MIASKITAFSLRQPRVVMLITLATVVFSGLGFLRIHVDTDPENMLPPDHAVRLRNDVLEQEFGAGPIVAIGVFGQVTSPAALSALSEVHQTLAQRSDVVAESTISVASAFDEPPTSAAEAAEVVHRIRANPFLNRNVLFDDGTGSALFVALTDKSVATEVADEAAALITAKPALANATVRVAGQPLAEDAFGQEMFVQMAIYAPAAGLLVFMILLVFFRRLHLVVPAMLLAMATVISTMGALIGSGNTLHIMSSMIPIFLMPVAILDSVHVTSEFFDRYDGSDRRELLSKILDDLQRPIGYTSLTTAAGFASLVLVPIPPVRVFGLFVAIGVGIAWLLTLSFLPAYLVSVAEARLGIPNSGDASNKPDTDGVLPTVGRTAVKGRGPLIVVAALFGIAAIPTLATVRVNDNPVRWFRSDHEVRVATDALTESLPGTFTASLLVSETPMASLDDPLVRESVGGLVEHLRSLPEVGAVYSYLDGPNPLMRADSRANVRMQLRTGDNVAMEELVRSTTDYLDAEPLGGLRAEWAGESYLNLVWQQEMVSGMVVGFATTLVVIAMLLTVLFRSVRWALLAMLPILWTILIVYGALAVLGRDLDMPVAVLSTLSLGIGIDFAIHFIARFRARLANGVDRRTALSDFYAEPARAVTRNAVVIGVGFMPLLLSSLVPYTVVGALLASIIALSWFATLAILPAIVAGPQRKNPTAVEAHDLLEPRSLDNGSVLSHSHELANHLCT